MAHSSNRRAGHSKINRETSERERGGEGQEGGGVIRNLATIGPVLGVSMGPHGDDEGGLRVGAVLGCDVGMTMGPHTGRISGTDQQSWVRPGRRYPIQERRGCGEGGRGYHGSSNGDSDGGNDGDDGRGMRGSSCHDIFFAVSALCFGPAVMTERISIRRQGLRKRETERRRQGSSVGMTGTGRNGRRWMTAMQSTLLLLNLEWSSQ